ncbi:MAG: hypothetical protein J6Q51_02585, partial [Clostridia bacterium]|nr:hypothetical protein [Clostridia bacterium]
MAFTDLGANVKQLSPSTAIADIKDGNVAGVYAQNGVAKVLLIEEKSEIKGEDREKFPQLMDYYFQYTTPT